MNKLSIKILRKFFWAPSRARISRSLRNDTRILVSGLKFIQASERNVAEV